MEECSGGLRTFWYWVISWKLKQFGVNNEQGIYSSYRSIKSCIEKKIKKSLLIFRHIPKLSCGLNLSWRKTHCIHYEWTLKECPVIIIKYIIANQNMPSMPSISRSSGDYKLVIIFFVVFSFSLADKYVYLYYVRYDRLARYLPNHPEWVELDKPCHNLSRSYNFPQISLQFNFIIHCELNTVITCITWYKPGGKQLYWRSAVAMVLELPAQLWTCSKCSEWIHVRSRDSIARLWRPHYVHSGSTGFLPRCTQVLSAFSFEWWT